MCVKSEPIWSHTNVALSEEKRGKENNKERQNVRLVEDTTTSAVRYIYAKLRPGLTSQNYCSVAVLPLDTGICEETYLVFCRF